jgi:hypothetical protein
MISFRDVVSTIASDAFKTAVAAKNGLLASQEMYHFQMAIHEHGEQAVVNETARILQERYRCSYAEAVVDAGHRVRAFLEIVHGERTFQVVRDNLGNAQRNPSGNLGSA